MLPIVLSYADATSIAALMSCGSRWLGYHRSTTWGIGKDDLAEERASLSEAFLSDQRLCKPGKIADIEPCDRLARHLQSETFATAEWRLSCKH